MTTEIQHATFVWVVRQNSDHTEGRGPMIDVAVCTSEDEAVRANYDVCGVMGVPKHYGGDIWKIRLNTYPPEQELVWGYRRDWNGKWGQGWLDRRDEPNEDDPEWIEYQRLRAKFDPSNVEIR